MRHLKRDRHGEMEFRTMVLLAALIIIFAPVAYVLLANPTPNYVNVSSQSGSSYIVYQSGTDTVAVNGKTSAIDYSGAVSSDVIQEAINALSTSGGKVQLSSGIFSISSTIAMKSNVILEGNGASTVLQLTANVPAITINGPAKSITVSNLNISVMNGQTNPAIYLHATNGEIYFCNIENIYTYSAYSLHGTNRAWTNIKTLSDSVYGMWDNKFSNIRAQSTSDKLIDIVMTNANAFFNGNNFENMWAYGYRIGVDFTNASGGYECTLNTFTNIQLETWNYSTDAFKSIWRFSNTFTACAVWDWAGAVAPHFIWSFDANSRANTIYESGMNLAASQVSDPGWGNTFIGSQWLTFVEAYGMDYINPGTTSVVVNHGMGITPKAVFLSGNGNGTSHAWWDRDSATNTTFTIHLDNTGGGWVYWHAVYRTYGSW